MGTRRTRLSCHCCKGCQGCPSCWMQAAECQMIADLIKLWLSQRLSSAKTKQLQHIYKLAHTRPPASASMAPLQNPKHRSPSRQHQGLSLAGQGSSTIRSSYC